MFSWQMVMISMRMGSMWHLAWHVTKKDFLYMSCIGLAHMESHGKLADLSCAQASGLEQPRPAQPPPPPSDDFSTLILVRSRRAITRKLSLISEECLSPRSLVWIPRESSLLMKKSVFQYCYERNSPLFCGDPVYFS